MQLVRKCKHNPFYFSSSVVVRTMSTNKKKTYTYTPATHIHVLIGVRGMYTEEFYVNCKLHLSLLESAGIPEKPKHHAFMHLSARLRVTILALAVAHGIMHAMIHISIVSLLLCLGFRKWDHLGCMELGSTRASIPLSVRFVLRPTASSGTRGCLMISAMPVAQTLSRRGLPTCSLTQ